MDLICPDPLDDPAEARRFSVHAGGALANVAVAASRAGAPAALAGGCGDDEWGRFLRAFLTKEGVGLEHYSEVPGLTTPFAFATLDRRGEPHFRIQGDGIDAGIATLAGNEDGLVAAAGAILVGSNTLPDPRSRAVTESVVAAAADAGVPVLFDPNLRPGRWGDLEEGRRRCLDLVGRTTVLKCNAGEARWLLGEEVAPADAAAALAKLGPRLVVVTAGTDPAVARGEAEAEVAPPPADVVCPLGAGDCFMGTLAAGLAAEDWSLTWVDAAMERAVRAGAEACTRLGAFD